jgi:thiol-disulfide isomerase/thioredoxin
MAFMSRALEPILALTLVGAGVLMGYGAYRATHASTDEVELQGDVQIASKGEAFDIDAFLVPGKYTIFDFYADWCPPCRVIDPKLRKLAADRDDVAVRKVDIVDWTTDVVKQHKITDLPHLQVYDPNGLLLVQGEEAIGVIEKMFGIEIF